MILFLEQFITDENIIFVCLTLALSGSLWLSLAPSGSLWLSIALGICLQSPCLAHKALARLVASLLRNSTLSSPAHLIHSWFGLFWLDFRFRRKQKSDTGRRKRNFDQNKVCKEYWKVCRGCWWNSKGQCLLLQYYQAQQIQI